MCSVPVHLVCIHVWISACVSVRSLASYYILSLCVWISVCVLCPYTPCLYTRVDVCVLCPSTLCLSVYKCRYIYICMCAVYLYTLSFCIQGWITVCVQCPCRPLSLYIQGWICELRPGVPAHSVYKCRYYVFSVHVHSVSLYTSLDLCMYSVSMYTLSLCMQV